MCRASLYCDRTAIGFGQTISTCLPAPAHHCWQLCGLLIRSSQVRILPITQGHGSLRPTLESYVEYLKRYNSPKWYVDILRGAWSEDQTYLAQGVVKS